MQNLSSYEIKNYSKGDVLYVKGDDAEYLYIIKSGSVRLFDGDSNHLMPVSLVSEKEFFGEQAIFSNTPRSLSAIVAESSELILIKKSSINEVLDLCPEWVADIIRLIGERLKNTNDAIFEHHLIDEVYAESDLNVTPEDLAFYKNQLEG